MTYKELNTDYNYEIEYRVNDLLLVFSFIRLYLVVKSMLYFTIYNSPRSERVCSLHGLYQDSFFSFKCYYREHPFITLYLTLIITSVIFGFQLKILESPMNEVSG